MPKGAISFTVSCEGDAEYVLNITCGKSGFYLNIKKCNEDLHSLGRAFRTMGHLMEDEARVMRVRELQEMKKNSNPLRRIKRMLSWGKNEIVKKG